MELRLHSDATRFTPERPSILMHVLSDALTWGLGFTQAIEERWPNALTQLRRATGHRVAPEHGDAKRIVALGDVIFTPVEERIELAHLIAERSRGNPDCPLELEALRTCFAQVAKRATITGAVVHAPPIGTGLCGARFADIQRLLESELTYQGILVVIHCLGGNAPQ